MAQHYSDPKREALDTSLPDIEAWEIGPKDRAYCPRCQDGPMAETREEMELLRSQHVSTHVGWYWWSCFPGCLPDSDACGPFPTEAGALEDAREGMEDSEDEDEA